MNEKIVAATSNNGKLKEIREIFSDYEILSMKDLNINIEVDEDQETFEGNALKKATEISKHIGLPCISDDSGIIVDFLDGFPGVRTARWMPGTDRDRNIGILNKMKDFPKEQRGCSFVTAIAFVDVSKNISIVKVNSIHGNIATELRGENGFGFDEIFELPNGKTFAELTPEERDNFRPRKFALDEIHKEL